MNGEIPLKDLSFYKSIVTDYLNENDQLKPLISDFPELSKFEKSIEEKFMPSEHRKVLSEVLSEQYSEMSLELNSRVKANINLLKDSRTFTVCTGHQLNLFTGPLYFLIKISQTISLSRTLKRKYPGYNFVPVYWMASEDHDLEEINHFNLFGQKRTWLTDLTGATGRMSTLGIEELAKETALLFERKPEVKELINKMGQAYNSSANLANATRELVHLLFNEEEVLVLDADAIMLKEFFKPYMEKELKEEIVSEKVNETNRTLESNGYHVQVNPREINLFYLAEGIRSRIIRESSRYQTDDGKTIWEDTEIFDELKAHPDRFSPNAAFRPIYQELILPNLATIGGPGEIAYWLQLKSLFQEFKVDYPFLIMRNSFSFMSAKNLKVVKEFNLEFKDLLQREEDFIKQASLSSANFDLTSEQEGIKEIYQKLIEKISQIDPTLAGRAHAALSNSEKQLSQLEAKVVKSIKAQQASQLKKLQKIQESVFANEALSERTMNFLELLNFMSWEKLKTVLLKEDTALDASLKVVNY